MLTGYKIAIAVSNSFYVMYCPLFTPVPNFIQIGIKTQKLVGLVRSDIQAGKRGQKKKNGPSQNFCMGLRIDPINMFQVFLGSFSWRKKFGPSETPNSLKFTRKISFFDFKLLENTYKTLFKPLGC